MEELKLSLFTRDQILYIQEPKNSDMRLLDTIIEFGKIAGYKINIQKSLALIYPNNPMAEKELLRSIPLTVAAKN